MSDPSPEPSPQRLQQVRALFERTASLPKAERETFVREQTRTDGKLADEVLTLLQRAESTGLAGAARRELCAPPQDAPTRSDAEHVQSTATGELMERLAKAPKLDEQRFVIEAEVGKGGMGAVLRIHDRHLNRRLAMKLLLERGQPRDDEEKKLAHLLLGRFLEEAQVTSQLDHPGVVPVHELGLDQRGKVYFTMRLVKGRTASEVFADAHDNENDWTTTRALEVILRVCDTMAYAHDKGVLHRDLKPINVMVGRFGEVYVMDWGLAKVMGQQDRHDLRIRKDESTGVSHIDSVRKRDAEGETGSSVVSMDGQQLGTPSYMPPEQARSEVLDQRADVYAIGAMMYELLTGRAPYTSPGARQPAYRILNDVLDGPPKRIEDVQKGVPAELVAIVQRAMAREREQRYANVTELAADVRAYIAQRTVRAYRTGALVEMKLWMRRNRALASSLAAAMLILVLGIAGTTTLWAKVSVERKNRIFADVSTLAEARTREEELYPALSDKVPAMQTWLRDYGEPLAARLPELEKSLVELQAKARPSTEAQRKAAQESHERWPEVQRRLSELENVGDTSRRDELRDQIATLQNEIAVAGYEFADATDGYVHRTLTRLVRDLRQFCGARGTLSVVKARLAEAQTVQQKTIDARRQEWDEAIGAITASDDVHASKLYEHFVLTPQPGLVPIGMDKKSKLWEFVHLASGTPGKEVPQRDLTTGKLTNAGDMGVVFVLLPGGKLRVENGKAPDHRHSVRLDPFFMSKYEMTHGQWLRLAGSNPRNSDTANLALPVDGLDWFDCEEVLRHQGFVLPSELRWEYGCRGGTTLPWWTGENAESLAGKENIDGANPPLPVGSLVANPLGLFDMSGNLCEWCLDVFGDYGTERDGDGLRPAAGYGSPIRCRRGGVFDVEASRAQSGYRGGGPAAYRSSFLGLRAARASRL